MSKILSAPIRPDIVCSACQAVNVVLPEVDSEGMTEGELWDAIEERLKSNGWTTERDEKGKRLPVCPTCAKPISLPEYDPRARCVKCGSNRVEIAYMGGVPTLRIKVEHMRKTCKRCGFIWREKCRDG